MTWTCRAGNSAHCTTCQSRSVNWGARPTPCARWSRPGGSASSWGSRFGLPLTSITWQIRCSTTTTRWPLAPPPSSRGRWPIFRPTTNQAGELGFLPELLAYQGLALLGLGQKEQSLALTRRALLSLVQGEVSEEVISEIYYAHAIALVANGDEDQAGDYFHRAYQNLLAGAAQLEDEPARQAFFHRNPILRRLMREVYARGIAAAPTAGVISRRLPALHGTHLVQVTWTLDAGPADLALKQAQGAIALRRARLTRLMREAQAQGAAPTVAQLAEALGVSKRTVQRDLAALRRSA